MSLYGFYLCHLPHLRKHEFNTCEKNTCQVVNLLQSTEHWTVWCHGNTLGVSVVYTNVCACFEFEMLVRQCWSCVLLCIFIGLLLIRSDFMVLVESLGHDFPCCATISGTSQQIWSFKRYDAHPSSWARQPGTKLSTKAQYSFLAISWDKLSILKWRQRKAGAWWNFAAKVLCPWSTVWPRLSIWLWPYIRPLPRTNTLKFLGTNPNSWLNLPTSNRISANLPSYIVLYE